LALNGNSTVTTTRHDAADPAGVRLGTRIARARQEAGLSEKDLAVRLGIPVWRIERLESGGEDPRTQLSPIAEATGKSPEWFLADKELLDPVENEERDGSGHLLRLRTAAKGLTTRLSRLRPPKSDPASAREPRKVQQSLVAVRIARARQEAGLSQKELADLLDVPLWRLDRIERGDEDAAAHLRSIAAQTGREHDWFIELLDSTAGSSSNGDSETAIAESPSAVQVEARADERTAASSPRSFRRDVVLGSLTLLVTIRFFTEVVHVLPKPAKLVDIPVLVVLVVAALALPRSSSREERSAWYAVPAGLFLIIAIISILTNLGRVAPAPSALFIYGFLSPVAVYYAVHHLWPTGHVLPLSRLLVGLALLQFVIVALVDLPRFLATGNPDVMTGTFGENGYQLVFFLLVTAAVVAGIYTFEKGRWAARIAPFFFVATLVTILLVQYRALLFTMALTVLLVATLLGFIRLRGAVAVVLIAVTFGLSLSYISSLYPQLKYASTVSTLVNDPGLYISNRLAVFGPIGQLYNDNARFIVTGTGPGTYSSRAWYTFQPAARSQKSFGLNPGGKTGYQTDVAQKYVVPHITQGVAQSIGGSYAVASPFSSYSAPLAEVGILGFLAIMSIYFGAFLHALRMTIRSLRQPPLRDPLPGLLLGCTAGFFVILQMAGLENWLEVTRVTFILWALLAVATKEFAARYGSPASN
jgi:transcriptional regulator with XRE-family HTH domain